jgi:hypothetical protein
MPGTVMTKMPLFLYLVIAVAKERMTKVTRVKPEQAFAVSVQAANKPPTSGRKQSHMGERDKRTALTA